MGDGGWGMGIKKMIYLRYCIEHPCKARSVCRYVVGMDSRGGNKVHPCLIGGCL